MRHSQFTWLVAFVLAFTFPAAAQRTAKVPEIMMINMGGNDCPPCVAWRRTELPKLQATEAFAAIRYVHVEKVIQSAVPPRFFLPPEVKPFKDKLDIASGGNVGSPQVAILVNGEVYDYYWATPSAEVVEQMILSITSGSPYPRDRCIRRTSRWRCETPG